MDYLHASERPTKLFGVRPEKEKHDLRGFAGALPKRSKQYMIYSAENAHRILGLQVQHIYLCIYRSIDR